MTTALEGDEGSASRPGRSLPPEKTRYPLYRRLGGSQGQSGQVRKTSPPTAIRSPDLPARSQLLCRLRYPAHSAYLAFAIKALSYYISTVVLCECDDWSHISREEHRLRVFKEMVWRKIFWSTRDEVKEEWRRLHNEELHDLCIPPDIRLIYKRKGIVGECSKYGRQKRCIQGFGGET